jgi:hypothetical protein
MKKSIVLAAVLAASPAAAAQNIIINNNVQVGAAHWCRGLGCLFWHPGSPGWPIAEQGPHACNVWNGRQYVRATCGP